MGGGDTLRLIRLNDDRRKIVEIVEIVALEALPAGQ
jgi:hypothetical protein